MKSSKTIMMACAFIALFALESCKREVSIDKLYQTFTQSVIQEQRDSGNVLTVDTIFLINTTGDNYKGELRGHVNDSTELVYDLDVTDEGKELTFEWNLRN